MAEEQVSRNLVTLERIQSAAIVRMNREDKRNALNADLIRELTDAIARTSEDPRVSGIVLTGGDRYFSAGADLSEAVRITTMADFEPFADRAARLIQVIEESPKPVIAAIHGPCITGGLELALACDERIAAQGATFAMTSARIGSVAGFGGTQRLPRLIGQPAAKRMMFTGRVIDADEALQLGLVDELSSPAAALDLALERVSEYEGVAPLSVSLTKRAVNAGGQMSLAASLELERALCARAFATRDKVEGMSSFLEKRSPRFEGR